MQIFRHEGQTVYELKKNLVIIKNHNKTRFYFPKAGLIKGLKGLCNIRFTIRPHKTWQYFHWLIRLPFFYCEKNNGGFWIGTNGMYLWSIK